MAIGRGPYIDQSQSMTVYMRNPTINQLVRLCSSLSLVAMQITDELLQHAMHHYGWKGDLKTGMYYLRTAPSTYPIAPGEHRAPGGESDSNSSSSSDSTSSRAVTEPRPPTPLPSCPACVV